MGTATTVLKDRLAPGLSYPLNLGALASALADETVAAYFVSTSTWAHQGGRRTSPRTPLLRLQRTRITLRVPGDDVAPFPEGWTLIAIAYAIPSRLRKAASDALLRASGEWSVLRPTAPGADDGLVVYLEATGGITVERKLPNWW